MSKGHVSSNSQRNLNRVEAYGSKACVSRALGKRLGWVGVEWWGGYLLQFLFIKHTLTGPR